MATLHLRNVPEELDAALAADAQSRGMSKNRRAIEALRRGLGLVPAVMLCGAGWDSTKSSALVWWRTSVASGESSSSTSHC